MAQAIGSMYYIGKVPIRLYWDSDRAAARNATGGGWVSEVGNYKIVNRAWDNGGVPVFSDPGGGAPPLYAINDITNSYAIGWIRDDDNITKGTLTNVPSSLSSEASSFQIGISKMAGSSYTLKIVVNGQQWVNYSGSADSINYTNFNYTHTMTNTSKDKLYSAMWNLTNATARVTLETVYNGQHLGTDSATINISIPASIKPTFTTNPSVSVFGAISGKNYAGIGGMQITNSPGWQPGRGATSTPYKVTVSNMRANGTNKWTFSNPGTAKLTYTISDSRGRSTSMEWTQAVEGTQPISVDSFTAKRNGSTGAKFEANGRYMASVDGTPTYQISRRERGTSSWTSVVTGTASVSSGRWSVSRTLPSGYVSNKSYDVRILVVGTSTNATGQSVLGTEAAPASFGMHGMGVGKVFDNSNTAMLQVGQDGIDSEGPIKIDGTDIMDLIGGGSSGGATAIPNGANLDTYTTAGEYYNDNPDHGILNYPTNATSGGRFYLIVKTQGSLSHQVIMIRRGVATTHILYRAGWKGENYSNWFDLSGGGSSDTVTANTIKKPDGTTIAWGKVSGTDASNAIINYPVTFTSAPNIQITVQHSNRWVQMGAHVYANTTTSAAVSMMHIVQGNANPQALADYTIHWKAIGKT